MTPTSNTAQPAGTRPPLPSQIAQQRVIAVLRGLPPDRLPQIVGALIAAGVGAVEVTLDSERAIESISRLRAHLAHDVVVGAGTAERGGDPEVIGARAREPVAAVATP
jgi:2-keto-3-deoxy-6-phosphogluconate aldolase